MNRLQRFFLMVLPRSWGRGIETASRAWMAHCPNCDQETSVWDHGGIRYKAVGNPKKLFRCPACGKIGMQALHYKPTGEAKA